MTSIFGAFLRRAERLTNNAREISSAAGRSTKLKIAPLQEAALEERCILVDELDRPLGDASKRICHRVDEHGDVPLHRAFSVFLFNKRGDLLLQKRADSKVRRREFQLHSLLQRNTTKSMNYSSFGNVFSLFICLFVYGRSPFMCTKYRYT